MTVDVGAALIVAAAAAIVAATGMGFNLLSTPLLSVVWAPERAVVTTLLIGLCLSAAVLVGRDGLRHADRRIVLGLMLSSLVGLPLGALALRVADARALRLLIGSVTVGYALLILSGSKARLPSGPAGLLLAGVAAGFLASSTGLSGPPVVLYLRSCDLKVRAFRATIAAYVVPVTAGGLLALQAAGAIRPDDARAALSLAPAAVAGFAIGLWLFRLLADRRAHFERLVVLALLVGGLLAAAGALFAP